MLLSEMKNFFELIIENCEYFKKRGEKFKDLAVILSELNKSVEEIFPKVEKVSLIAIEYDFDSETPANGFHSFVDFFTSAIKEIHAICFKLKTSRSNKIFFSKVSFQRYKISHE